VNAEITGEIAHIDGDQSRTRASIHRVTLRRFGHGVMGPGRPANGPGGPTRDGRAAARRIFSPKRFEVTSPPRMTT
jgi:hypothetical protein